MQFRGLHDKKIIRDYLDTDKFLHIYSLGDLDDFFWPFTTWYGTPYKGSLEAIALMYFGYNPPTLLALTGENNLKQMQNLINSILHLFPSKFYAHLSTNLDKILENQFQLESFGLHYKMALTNSEPILCVDCSLVQSLSSRDISQIEVLYSESYPGNWFDSRMLETNQYYGIYHDEKLVSIAGIHVYSPKYKVAALGNITTHPNFRGKGYGSLVTAKLCQSLLKQDLSIGLNVKSSNKPALSCYKNLGFEIIASYEEFLIEKR